MGYEVISKILPTDVVKAELPLSDELRRQVHRDRDEINKILEGYDQRLLVIVGPCSAWPMEAVIAYAKKLAVLKNQIKDSIKIVMRVYTQKPRTLVGWNGLYVQPDLDNIPDLGKGRFLSRQLLLTVLKLGLPIASEIVFIDESDLILDLLSWAAIGARSSQNHLYRSFASLCDLPVGLKNPPEGGIELALNSVKAAQSSIYMKWDDKWIKTTGNPTAHLVLRGANNKPNYFLPALLNAQKLMGKLKLRNGSLLVDASHDNAIKNDQKSAAHQVEVSLNLLQWIQENDEIAATVKGIMLESFIKAGNQPIDNLTQLDYDGLSITDPCLSWEQTETLLMTMHSMRHHTASTSL